MIGPPPLQLLIGARGHGVVEYAADVASALLRIDDSVSVVSVPDAADAVSAARGVARVHMHVTDRLLGRSPEEAARNLERLAGVTSLTVTVHDVPQASDGTALSRRVAAYTRFFSAAHAAAVNSRHEQRLVAEFLPAAAAPHAFPLGARVDAAPERASAGFGLAGSGVRDLIVLLAGYVYPGKGHAPAIRAAGEAAGILRAAGEPVGAVVVRAIGGPSAGHEADVERLRADAGGLGVRFDTTGFLDDAAFARGTVGTGIPLVAHEHVSASRSMLDWVEGGRRPLVVSSRYAREMAALRPGTISLYEPAELPRHLVDGWRDPERAWLETGVSLAPTLDDVARDYRAWWHRVAPR